MAGIFKVGDEVEAINSGSKVKIMELLGSSGRSEVYRVMHDSSELALKWYSDHMATESQKSGIENLIENGAPGPQFLWPLELVKSRHSSSFGYLMPLRAPRFKSFVDIFRGRIDPTFEILMIVGLNLVDSFHKLHAAGLCYREISFGNGFFDPLSGETLICANEAVSPNNCPSASFLGSHEFTAPEAVLGKARPNRQTDYFSLSVLLFYLFHIQHPLIGRKFLSIRVWDSQARHQLFVSEPVFIFDPSDRSNEAVEDPKMDPHGRAGINAIPYWRSIYPQKLKDTFTTAFTEGIRNPDRRPLATAWKQVLTNALNSITKCACGKENFAEPGGQARACWHCGKSIAVSFILETGGQVISASTGKRILESHLSDPTLNPMSTQVGEIVTHPQRKDALGLCNKTNLTWTAQPAGESQMVTIPPGKSILVCDGTVVIIGGNRIKIRKLNP
jgi:DNA-binding helix-hairpin-helix protein with protein kinase domain